MTPESLLGRFVESMPLPERLAAAGLWVAYEIYTPENMALRRIEAAGRTHNDCITQLQSRGLDPARFEYTTIPAPY